MRFTSTGITWNRSPTMPKCAMSKFGAFGLFRALHAGLVLDRARDAAGDVDLRLHTLASYGRAPPEEIA
jgi:hypothetical protein